MRAAIILLAVFIAGCGDRTVARQLILTDVDTGCEYIGNVGSGIINPNLKPRMDKADKQFCKQPKGNHE